MRQVKKQIETFNESLKEQADAKEIINSGKELIKKIDQWESNLIEPRSKNFQDVINFPNKLNSEFLPSNHPFWRANEITSFAKRQLV